MCNKSCSGQCSKTCAEKHQLQNAIHLGIAIALVTGMRVSEIPVTPFRNRNWRRSRPTIANTPKDIE